MTVIGFNSNSISVSAELKGTVIGDDEIQSEAAIAFQNYEDWAFIEGSLPEIRQVLVRALSALESIGG